MNRRITLCVAGPITLISALTAGATACGASTPPADLPPPAQYAGIFLQGAEQLFFVPCPAESITRNLADLAFSDPEAIRQVQAAASSIGSTRAYIEFTGRCLTATDSRGFGVEGLSVNYSVDQLLRVEPRMTCP